MKDNLVAFDRLIKIMNELREQCPWDKKQTMESLRHLTIEEVYEPFLIQQGFIMRTPRGREVTEAAYKHLGKKQNRPGELF